MDQSWQWDKDQCCHWSISPTLICLADASYKNWGYVFKFRMLTYIFEYIFSILDSQIVLLFELGTHRLWSWECDRSKREWFHSFIELATRKKALLTLGIVNYNILLYIFITLLKNGDYLNSTLTFTTALRLLDVFQYWRNRSFYDGYPSSLRATLIWSQSQDSPYVWSMIHSPYSSYWLVSVVDT